MYLEFGSTVFALMIEVSNSCLAALPDNAVFTVSVCCCEPVSGLTN